VSSDVGLIVVFVYFQGEAGSGAWDGVSVVQRPESGGNNISVIL
jgi:hypothetical protein